LRLSPTLFLVGLLLIGLAATMLAPLGVALFYADGSAGALVKSIIITVAGGAFLAFAFRPTERISLSHREGMGVVALAWMAAGLFGCLPFLLGGVFDGLTDSYFEAISGFTTTGASVLTQIEGLPKGLLFWRSLTHWLGGMGIIVLGVAILPLVGCGRHAALQGRGPLTSGGPAQAPHHRDGPDDVEGLPPHLGRRGGAVIFRRHGPL